MSIEKNVHRQKIARLPAGKRFFQSAIALCVYLALSLSLTACGWQLRSQADTVLIDSLTVKGGSADFVYQLEQALEDDGVVVHDDSPRVLLMSAQNWDTRTVAVDKVGRAAETELTLRFHWQVFDLDGKALSLRQYIGTSRRYQVSSENATGASDEDFLAREDMRREMVARIMRALSKLAPTLEMQP
jgi:LPS-assembly lipoprotein